MSRADLPSQVLYIGPSADDPDPALALRGNMKVKVRGNRFTISCPYCGAKVSGRIKAGAVGYIELAHEAWCPVPTDRELLARRRKLRAAQEN